MGLFDSISQAFGPGAAPAKSGDDQFTTLKQKYQSVLNSIDQGGGRVQGLYVEDGKLRVIAVAPSEEAKNKAWDQIKAVDPNFGDLSADITVDEGQGQGDTETYTVKGGDSLWRIAQNQLGSGNRYMEIFYANRDKMDSPQSVIHPGDELKIPKG
jgi:nucleoid-associated protein YgaU